jgi:hypothetical protein
MTAPMKSPTAGYPRAWLALSFGDQRQYAGNAGYRDDPDRIYPRPRWSTGWRYFSDWAHTGYRIDSSGGLPIRALLSP